MPDESGIRVIFIDEGDSPVTMFHRRDCGTCGELVFFPDPDLTTVCTHCGTENVRHPIKR